MKQGQPGTPGKDAGSQDTVVTEPERPPGKPTPANGWGQGSASALENLRKRNYRGRRSRPGEDRPAAE